MAEVQVPMEEVVMEMGMMLQAYLPVVAVQKVDFLVVTDQVVMVIEVR